MAKKITVIIITFIIIFGAVFFAFGNKTIERGTETRSETDQAETQTEIEEELLLTTENMEISSTEFNNNENIPSKFTCDGENINPSLTIKDIPENTQSLVLIVDDPDAPAGTWVHWIIWNIDPATTEIQENSVPNGGVEGTTSFGKTGYGGPCPPSGTHRYFFKLYALDTTLELDTSSQAEDLINAMQGHILDTEELVGLYSRE